MIKPTYLWALCKTCSDSKWIGDICRFLGGQEVELDFGQRQVADMVKMDSEWMDERINWNREAARMRQARARERRAAERAAAEGASRDAISVTRDNAMSREVTRSHARVTPSIRPSVRNINNKQDNTTEEEGGDAPSPPPPVADDLVEGEAARMKRPTRSQVMDAATIAGVKPDVAERWLGHMRQMDWHFSNGGRVTALNFRTSLMRFAARDRDGEPDQAGRADAEYERKTAKAKAESEAAAKIVEELRREGLA